jgi:prepilin-type N-terminal cleavage/methylation domain-containing protein
VTVNRRKGEHLRIGATGRSSGGFTLLEILLSLALIGLLTAVLVTASMHLTDAKPVTAEDVFWNAVAESRKAALLSGHDVRLRFASGNKSRALIAATPAGERRFELPDAETVIDFLNTQKGGSAILIRSQLVETQTLPFVTFYGDGTCSPFRVQIRTGGPARSVSIDPWTCSPILSAGSTP